jgi:hypothetical protein
VICQLIAQRRERFLFCSDLCSYAVHGVPHLSFRRCKIVDTLLDSAYSRAATAPKCKKTFEISCKKDDKCKKKFQNSSAPESQIVLLRREDAKKEDPMAAKKKAKKSKSKKKKR